jgi:hypothetical protein
MLAPWDHPHRFDQGLSVGLDGKSLSLPPLSEITANVQLTACWVR